MTADRVVEAERELEKHRSPNSSPLMTVVCGRLPHARAPEAEKETIPFLKEDAR